ncbi:MAG: dockerin type I repeat-containing protein, partial [Eubacterium sp.]|nr:dockerin type I repeat-containing protein [Eubacterium sp.]
SGIIGTGDILKIVSDDGIFEQFTVILYGDVNGDGEIDLLDIVRLKRNMLGWIDLSDIYMKAADVNRKDGVDLIDIVAIKNHILGVKMIVQ